MGKWIFRKPEPSTVRGLCVICEKNKQKKKKEKFLSICSSCEKELYQKTPRKKRKNFYANSTKGVRSYRKFKKDHCEKCGFIPLHMCQLDVDHINGDHTDNNPINLQTLCSNCHRIKTYKQRHNVPPEI